MEQKEEMSFFALVITVLAGLAVYLLFIKPKKSKKTKKNQSVDPSKYEELLKQRLEKFIPAPLVEPLNDFDKLNLEGVNRLEVISKPSRKIRVRVDGMEKELVNFGSVDFLGFATDDKITGEIAVEALNHYGVGSCGPRSFYGTFDVHLILERTLANWFGTEGAIVYSDSFATIPGVLGAFIEKSDIIIADEGVNQSIRNGIILTRAKPVFYKHTDLEDCRNKFESILKTKKPEQRLFLVSESIFRTTGKVADINGLVQLRQQYKARLLVDESLAIGVLGPTGRGLWEQEGVNVEKIDFLCGSLDNAFATVGGFCASNQVIKTHQRLAGAGYIFSAAVAPVLSVTANASIQTLAKAAKERGSQENWLCSTLRKNIRNFHEKFGRNESLRKKMTTTSSHFSPIFHLCLKEETSKLTQYRKVREICRMLENKGIFAVATAQTPHEQSLKWLKPSIKLSFSTKHTVNDIDMLLQALGDIADQL